MAHYKAGGPGKQGYFYAPAHAYARLPRRLPRCTGVYLHALEGPP